MRSSAILRSLCSSSVSSLTVEVKFPGGATVKKNVGKTSCEAVEVVYQWYVVC